MDSEDPADQKSGNEKMRLELIMPAWPPPFPLVPPYPPLSLAILATETPDDFEVKIVDENVEDIDFDEEVDLVGITAFTFQTRRAYEIASKFREKNTKVVMGGVHASSVPEEALQYVDSVVIGEAEGVWRKVIEDFKRDDLKKTYKAEKHPQLENLPIPRRDLVKSGKYVFKNTIMTTRGCPFNCDFCVVPSLFGTKIRHRPVEEVVEEIKMMVRGKRGFDRFVYILDDNLGYPPKYYKSLFKALIPLHILWAGEANVKVAEDEELIKIAAKSGCHALMLGFESLSKKSLHGHGKSYLNPDTYENAVKRIHRYGIQVHGFFIFGLDSDDETVFEETVKWVRKNQIEKVQFAPLTHFPSTEIYRKNKDRLLSEKWWMEEKLPFIEFNPRSMSREALRDGITWAWKQKLLQKEKP